MIYENYKKIKISTNKVLLGNCHTIHLCMSMAAFKLK